MKTFYVYEHTRNDTGNVFYVGKGHAKRAFSRHNRSKYWNSIVAKSAGFSACILVDGVDEELAFLVEMERIDQLRKLGTKLCNLTDGGDGQSGYRHTIESREKMSKSFKGRGKGIPKSPELKAKLSAALKGRKLTYIRSEETRRRMSDAQKKKLKLISTETKQKISKALIGTGKGVPKSAETRAKMSEAAKIKIFSDEHRKNLSMAGKGRKHSEETKLKMAESRRRYYAGRHANDVQRILDSWPKNEVRGN